ncbi:MAG: phosphatase PAP2 family protein [Patescibacteria group bacterium]
MNTLIILCAQYLIWAIVIAGFVYLVQSPLRKKMVLFAAAALAASYVVAKVIGWFWYDPRPFVSDGITPLIAHAANNGFPSDHMLFGATIASIVFVYNRPLGIVLWVLALTVGIARILAGVHHTADIVGAALIAAAAVALVYRFMPRHLRH